MAVGSTFISRNNPDRTDQNMNELLAEAGLPRKDTLLWNIVPWYIGSGKKIRSPTMQDLFEATPYLADLIGLLPKLAIIVLVGKAAGSTEPFVKSLTRVPLFAMPHPSPQSFNTRPEMREEARRVLKLVREALPRD